MKRVIMFRPVSLIAVIMVSLLTACEVKINGEELKTSGKTVTQPLQATGFTSVRNETFFDVRITQGTETKVDITGDELLVPELEVSVENQQLRLRLKKKNYSFHWKQRPGTINVTMPDIRSLVQAGSGDIDLRSLKNEKLEVRTEGSGDVRLSGETAELVLTHDSSSDVDADTLAVKN